MFSTTCFLFTQYTLPIPSDVAFPTEIGLWLAGRNVAYYNLTVANLVVNKVTYTTTPSGSIITTTTPLPFGPCDFTDMSTGYPGSVCPIDAAGKRMAVPLQVNSKY
jgi:hypothetical protein